MHSSRIRTIRSVPYGGGWDLCPGGEISVQMGLCPGGLSLSGGSLSRAVSVRESLSRVVSVRESLSRGSLSRGCLCSGGLLTEISSSGNRITDSCYRVAGVGVFVQGGLCPGGSLSRGISVQGDLCLGGCLCSGGLLTEIPSSVNRITDRCKNITLRQLRCGR